MKKKAFIHTTFIALLILTLSISLFFIKTSFLADSTTKTDGFFVNDIFDFPSAELKNGQTIKQDFSTGENIYGIRVRFSNKGEPQPGNILVEIAEKKSGNIILSKVENSETMLNDAYTAINFDSPYMSKGKADFVISITPTLKNANGYMALWENSATGDWAFGLVTYIVSDFIYSWFNILSVLVILSAVGTYLACFVFKLKKETTFIICLCLVSVLFNFVLPPYSSPDEEAHINSAYRLSNKVLDQREKSDFSGPTIYKRAGDYNETFENKYTTVLSYEYIYNNFFKFAQSKELVPQEDSWLVSDFPAVYGLGAVAIKLGRILKLGYVPLLYLGRLFNLAFFALCSYMAIKLAPTGKGIFMSISLLPVTLHLANSFSRDAFVISMAFVFIAYILKLLYQKEACTVKDAAILSIMCALLAPSKMIYAPICLLVLLLGKGKLDFFKIKKKHLFAMTATVLVIIAVATGGLIVSCIVQALSPTGVPLEELIYTAPETTFNISIMLANPIVSIKLILNTIYSNGAYYIKSLMGGVLGYNSIIISDFFVFTFLVLTIISTCKTYDENIEIKTFHKLSFWAIFGTIFLLVVYAGISWTPIIDKTIYGIQGKYLLPCLPLLLLAIKNKTFTVTKDVFKPLCFVAAITNIFVVLNAFTIIVQR